MKKNNPYDQAHLVIAAIRLHDYQHDGPPTIENICEMLSISIEEGNRLVIKLSEMEIIESLAKPGGTRIFIKNHLGIEEISRQPENIDFQSELEQFNESKKAHIEKIKTIQVEQAEKKKKLQEELDQKLKAIMNKK